VVSTILTAVTAAVVAFVFANLSEILRERRSFRSRWDRDIQSLVSEYLAATRRLMHLSGDTVESAQREASLGDALQDLRMRCGQLLVLADPELARHAVNVQSRAYELVKSRTTGLDPRPDGHSPMRRLYDAVELFVGAARVQLRLPPIDGIQRSSLPMEFKTFEDDANAQDAPLMPPLA
jgi:hypothetical protein